MKAYLFTKGTRKVGSIGNIDGHPNVLDAIRYGQQTNWLTIIEDGEIVSKVDATNLLRTYACNEALRASSLWEMPEIVHTYLRWRDPDKREGAHTLAVKALNNALWKHQIEAIRLAVYASDADPTAIINDAGATDTCSIMLARMSREKELQQLL